jgi:hypothetical protein
MIAAQASLEPKSQSYCASSAQPLGSLGGVTSVGRLSEGEQQRGV